VDKGPERSERGPASADALLRRLVVIYTQASLIAVFGGAVLFGFGLDLTARQIALGLGVIAPVSFAAMFALDVLAIRRTARPIVVFLRASPPRPELAEPALVRAMNLPVLTAARVMGVHAPTAAVSITLLMLGLNRYAALGVGPGQIVVLWLLVLFVGVGHALIEYYAVADAVRPLIRRIWPEVGVLGAEARRRIVTVDMRRILLCASGFLVFVPMLVLGVSVLAKVNRLLVELGVHDAARLTGPLYWWVGLLIAGSTAVVVFMATRTAREVVRGAHEMARGMERVERDELDASLTVTAASEFAALYEGFNAMVGRLKALIELREQRAAELAALRSREHLHSLTEKASDVITILRPDGEITYASAPVERVLGLLPTALVGSDVFARIHPENVSGVRATLAQLVDEASPLELPIEFRAQHRDGTWRVLESIAKRGVDMSGQVVLIVNSRDVTERRSAEAALRDSEARFRSAFDDAGVGMALQSVDGRYVRVNRALVQMLGRSEAELTGMAEQALLHPEERRETPAGGVARPDRPGGGPREHRYLHKAGHTVWALVSRSRVGDTPGGPAHVVVQMQDVTGLRQAERQRALLEGRLLQAEKIEAIGRLAGGIAHDFNNLLTIILGRTQLMLQSAGVSAVVRRQLDTIQETAKQGAMLTRQLLAFTRKQVVEPRVVDLNVVVAQTERMLRRLVGEDVDLVVRPSAGPALVRADPGQLGQVVLNLVVNARDAMTHGGQATLTIGEAGLDDAAVRPYGGVRPGPFVTLAVADTGIGIDARTRARLFEPFFTTKAGKGTGLGLATVYGIVSGSGGFVTVDSEPAQGATFTVYLPRAEAGRERGEESRQARVSGGSETILLTEDEEQVRLLTAEILAAQGYQVISASHGAEALEFADGHPGPIDLLMTDVVMPQMSGRELADRLVERRPGLQVLYMSGHTDDTLVQHGVQEAGRAFIQKPFSMDELTRRVREVLDARRRESAS
jgi:PAS domain S-box-containing protein